MTSELKRKRKAGITRTEVFAMRLDPKLKYLAEIAARKQRRSLANFMEWSIEVGLRDTPLREYEHHRETVFDFAEKLWDVDEADRLANLALVAPDLLTYDEQVLWKVIAETGFIWKGKHDVNGVWKFDPTKSQSLNRDRLRDLWQTLNSVALGVTSREALPQVAEGISTATTTLDGDIPF